MFKFEKTNGQKIRAFFRYQYSLVAANPNKAKSRPHSKPVSTFCILADDKSKQKLAEAAAFCSEKDRFSYFVGRKIALSRALEALKLNREERKNAWKNFLEM